MRWAKEKEMWKVGPLENVRTMSQRKVSRGQKRPTDRTERIAARLGMRGIRIQSAIQERPWVDSCG